MTIQEYVERGRKAVEAIKDYDQAQTDKLVYEAAKIIYQHAAELAREAVDETGLGYYEDRSPWGSSARTRRRGLSRWRTLWV